MLHVEGLVAATQSKLCLPTMRLIFPEKQHHLVDIILSATLSHHALYFILALTWSERYVNGAAVSITKKTQPALRSWAATSGIMSHPPIYATASLCNLLSVRQSSFWEVWNAQFFGNCGFQCFVHNTGNWDIIVFRISTGLVSIDRPATVKSPLIVPVNMIFLGSELRREASSDCTVGLEAGVCEWYGMKLDWCGS